MSDRSQDHEPDHRAVGARAAQAGVDVDALERLWAGWRAAYVTDERPEGCPFCVIPARGEEHDTRSLILHRGRHCYVIMNAYPYNPGHVMVVPFLHSDDLGSLDEETAEEMWRLGRLAVRVLRDRLSCGGVNLGMNLWRAGGAGIADHLHLHAVPRWSGDTNFMGVVGATRILPVALSEVYDQLHPGFGVPQ